MFLNSQINVLIFFTVAEHQQGNMMSLELFSVNSQTVAQVFDPHAKKVHKY